MVDVTLIFISHSLFALSLSLLMHPPFTKYFCPLFTHHKMHPPCHVPRSHVLHAKLAVACNWCYPASLIHPFALACVRKERKEERGKRAEGKKPSSCKLHSKGCSWLPFDGTTVMQLFQCYTYDLPAANGWWWWMGLLLVSKESCNGGRLLPLPATVSCVESPVL